MTSPFTANDDVRTYILIILDHVGSECNDMQYVAFSEHMVYDGTPTAVLIVAT